MNLTSSKSIAILDNDEDKEDAIKLLEQEQEQQ
jgi:hypothetical protein